MTFYRIQTADRDTADLLCSEFQISHNWNDMESDNRAGVSVCTSQEALAAYLAQSGIPYGDGEWVIVELDGDVTDDDPCDAEYGEILIYPTAIVSVSAMDEEFFELIGAAYDALSGE